MEASQAFEECVRLTSETIGLPPWSSAVASAVLGAWVLQLEKWFLEGDFTSHEEGLHAAANWARRGMISDLQSHPEQVSDLLERGRKVSGQSEENQMSTIADLLTDPGCVARKTKVTASPLTLDEQVELGLLDE